MHKNLRAEFPAYKGWEIYRKDRWVGYEPDFTVERKVRGKIQRAIVEVKATCNISQAILNQLNSYTKKLSGRGVEIVEKILAVPAGTDTSNVPDDVKIMFLKSFKCEDNKIVWYE